MSKKGCSPGNSACEEYFWLNEKRDVLREKMELCQYRKTHNAY